MNPRMTVHACIDIVDRRLTEIAQWLVRKALELERREREAASPPGVPRAQAQTRYLDEGEFEELQAADLEMHELVKFRKRLGRVAERFVDGDHPE